jgi:hypothetical protein
MAKTTCKRCEKPTVFTTLVTVCLDGNSVQLQLCDNCARNCRADVALWQMFGQTTTDHVRHAATATRPRSATLPSHTTPAATRRSNVKVPFPIIKRAQPETVPDDGQQVLLAPEILRGHDRADVARATQRWTWASGCRARVLGRNIDPVDVLLVADTDTPDEIVPGDVPSVEMVIARGLRVIVARETSLILDAYVAF